MVSTSVAKVGVAGGRDAIAAILTVAVLTMAILL